MEITISKDEERERDKQIQTTSEIVLHFKFDLQVSERIP